MVLTSTLLHVAIYSAGTFFSNPVKILLNALVGSKYAVAYAHFRRDHSVPLNIWLHGLCMVIQILGNFALLDVWDEALGRPLLAPLTGFMWIFFLSLQPSPVSVKLLTGALILLGLVARSLLSANFLLLALLQAPFEIACYWLILPYHGIKQPSKKGMSLMLAARVGLWFLLRPLQGALVLPGGKLTANVLAATFLAVGSLVRASDNMPLCEHLGLAAWAPAILLDLPWLFFLCISFIGQALQGVSHEITKQPGTLPQLNDPRHELAHCAYFPALVIQSMHHHFTAQPFPPTVSALGDYSDKRSRLAMGLPPLGSD